jgi:hypothetical protein
MNEERIKSESYQDAGDGLAVGRGSTRSISFDLLAADDVLSLLRGRMFGSSAVARPLVVTDSSISRAFCRHPEWLGPSFIRSPHPECMAGH